MNMSTLVEYVRYNLVGDNQGQQAPEQARFKNWDAACEWAGNVTMDSAETFVILEMTHVVTGETQQF